MRRTAPTLVVLLVPLVLSGCTGFGEFLDHTFTIPTNNPNIPMADSENVRRALGRGQDVAPLQPEPGNVWPGPQGPDPTLSDLQGQQGTEDRRGFPPTTVPSPGLPAHAEPRPRGSSTPPAAPTPGPTPAPGVPPLAPLAQPRSTVPGPGPQGQIVQTPQGQAVDTGGTSGYRQLNGPTGGAIMVPNGNGTSTIINPNGTVQTVPTPR